MDAAIAFPLLLNGISAPRNFRCQNSQLECFFLGVPAPWYQLHNPVVSARLRLSLASMGHRSLMR
jgi:hypothetical protein